MLFLAMVPVGWIRTSVLRLMRATRQTTSPLRQMSPLGRRATHLFLIYIPPFRAFVRLVAVVVGGAALPHLKYLYRCVGNHFQPQQLTMVYMWLTSYSRCSQTSAALRLPLRRRHSADLYHLNEMIVPQSYFNFKAIHIYQ